MIKILITGGAGFIGSSLVDRLIKNPNYFIVAVDSLVTGKVEYLPTGADNYRFIKCDVNNYSDIAPVMTSYSFDYVFHYAALVGVTRTLENPTRVLDDIDGIKNILQLSKNTGVQRIFYSSSSEVYGEPVELPQNEQTTPLNSRLPYAIVKNLGEAYCKSYKQEYDLDYTIFRFFNTYGPKQSEDFVVSRFLSQAQSNLPITIYGNGDQTRTFCYIEDNVEAVCNAFQKNLFINDVVNIGSDFEIKISELAELILEVTNTNSSIVHLDPLEDGDMTRRQPDISKMKLLLERDQISMKSGIARIMASQDDQ